MKCITYNKHKEYNKNVCIKQYTKTVNIKQYKCEVEIIKAKQSNMEKTIKNRQRILKAKLIINNW